MKIHPVGAEMFHANRRTDMLKLIVAFRNFANAPQTLHYSIVHYSVIWTKKNTGREVNFVLLNTLDVSNTVFWKLCFPR